jgi:acyl-CoA synthetase (AMP-forming)/AMP-acid ligase II
MNAAQPEPPSTPRTLSALIAGIARLRPDAPAILAPHRAALSWVRLAELVENTRRALRAAGVAGGDRVAVVQPNGPEAATAFIAMGASAAFAPLNPSYAEAELEFFLTDLGARALIVQEGLESAASRVAARLGVPAITLRPAADGEAGWFTLAGTAAPDAADRPTGEDDVALVLHTSGTTSRPKMVPLRHLNLCVSAENIARSLALSPSDRSLNIMPLFHIHGLVGSVLASLAAGGSVACTPGFNAARFFEWMDELAPTWYTAVPTMHMAVLARAAAHAEVIARRPLRLIRSCSSSLPPRVMADLERVFGAPVLEAYGMTEASHQIASNPLPPGERRAGSVGLPTGVEVAVVGEDGEPAGAGAAGEVVIRGRNVTHGYAGPPELTAAAFRNGWFRTGDQGRLDVDGYLYLTGRLKEMINRGGEKVSPREIDEVVLDHPGVAEAIAFAVPHAQLGEEIGVAVVPRQGASVTEAEIREHAARRLAAFKVPRVVRIVAAIPKGPTGKPQRIGLAEKLGVAPLDYAQTRSAVASAAPPTGIEARLAAIWRRVLDCEAVGAEDDFFALGGDSVLAVLLLEEVARELGGEIPMLAFLERPTIAAMAASLASAGTGGAGRAR